MSDIRDVLIRGSKKIIAHYRFLLSRTTSESERELYRRWFERKQRLLDDLLQGASQGHARLDDAEATSRPPSCRLMQLQAPQT